jgi:hypothetical protein
MTTTIQTRVKIENIGTKTADRLLEGEWVIVGDRVGTVDHAWLCNAYGYQGKVNVHVVFHYPAPGRGPNGKKPFTADKTLIVDRKERFTCIAVTVEG